MKSRTWMLLILLVTLTGCTNNNGTYYDLDGNMLPNVSDNAAYNMAIRDTEIASEKMFIEAMKTMANNPVGQAVVAMAFGYKKGQGPKFQQPRDWVDKTLMLYPIIRDVLSIAGWGILPGGNGSGGGTIAMDRVNVGGDFYANGSVRNDKIEASGYQANVPLTRSGGSVSEDNDNYEGNAQSANAGGDGNTSTANPYERNTGLFE